MKLNVLIGSSLLAVLFLACTNKKGKVTPSTNKPSAGSSACDTVTYAKHVLPIINASCAFSGCHVAGFPLGDFTSYAGVKIKVDEGKIRQKVLLDKSMPKTPTPPLTQKQLDIISCWLEKGAPNN